MLWLPYLATGFLPIFIGCKHIRICLVGLLFTDLVIGRFNEALLSVFFQIQMVFTVFVSLFLQYPPPYFLMLNEEQMKAFSDDFNELQHADITENPLTDAITRRKIELLLLNLITQFSQSTPYPTRPAPQNISHLIDVFINRIYLYLFRFLPKKKSWHAASVDTVI